MRLTDQELAAWLHKIRNALGPSYTVLFLMEEGRVKEGDEELLRESLRRSRDLLDELHDILESRKKSGVFVKVTEEEKKEGT